MTSFSRAHLALIFALTACGNPQSQNANNSEAIENGVTQANTTAPAEIAATKPEGMDLDQAKQILAGSVMPQCVSGGEIWTIAEEAPALAKWAQKHIVNNPDYHKTGQNGDKALYHYDKNGQSYDVEYMHIGPSREGGLISIDTGEKASISGCEWWPYIHVADATPDAQYSNVYHVVYDLMYIPTDLGQGLIADFGDTHLRDHLQQPPTSSKNVQLRRLAAGGWQISPDYGPI